MKSKLLTTLLAMCVALSALVGLISCGDETNTPTKLSTPTVTLTDDLASWEANPNADKFEISLDGNLSYVENTVTSKTLTDGQSLKIRAVGDGVLYSTGDWSNSVTYTKPAGEGPEDETPEGDGPEDDGPEGDNPAEQPTKLQAPTVTLSDTGLASWTAVAGASGYAYKINGGAETATSATSVQLTDGQSITVKAVGNGTGYTDSDYSAEKTYTAAVTPPPADTDAPTYLGILASNARPSERDLPTNLPSRVSMLSAKGLTLADVFKEYLSNPDNALGDTAPNKSEYTVYSAMGEVVYIQIWLDNPDQNTILSLKLNGTKYQTGIALQSFFIADGNSYLNCVYVAVTVPQGSYEEISYEVTEIEYVEGTNVSQDGKAVMIDGNNDTVTIGLPYEERLPTAVISDITKTASTVSFNANITDEDGLTALRGGWLRAIIHDQSNNILGQQKLSVGSNSVTFTNLSAENYYGISVVLFADTHDGEGIAAHTLARENALTEKAISCTIESEILLNEQSGKYYPVINVDAELNDPSFTLTRIELRDGEEPIFTSEFDGSVQIIDGILNDKYYYVFIYYENALGTEQAYREVASVDRLHSPYVNKDLEYGLIDDAILGFDFGSDKWNIDNLKIQIFDEESKQYLAENALFLIENPSAIEELEAQWQNMGRDNPDFHGIYDRWYKLTQTKNKIEEKYSSVTKGEWEAELAKGIYLYEYTFGSDEEFFRGAGNKYYVFLDGYQSRRVDDNSWKYVITADVDHNDGNGVENKQLGEGFFNIAPALTDGDYMFVEYDRENDRELFYLDEDNVVHLQVMSRNNLGNESHRQLGYVNQIVLADGYDVLAVLWTQEEPEHSIDEGAWLAELKAALIAGEEIDEIFPLEDLKPISFELDEAKIPETVAGNYYIRYTYKMYGKEYSAEHPYDMDGTVIDYKVVRQLPIASVDISCEKVRDYGSFEIIVPEYVKGGSWYHYTVEVKNASGVSLGTFNQDNVWEASPLSANYTVRVKLDADEYIDYYTDGEWSDWFLCTKAKLDTPTEFTQEKDEYGVRLSWGYVEGAVSFVYVLKGGEPMTAPEVISGLKNGDTVKIKAIPEENGNFIQSDYSAVFTVTDDRTVLAAPSVSSPRAGYITWNAVDNASSYVIYDASTYSRVSDTMSTSCYVAGGKSYYVVAIPANSDEYVASRSATVSVSASGGK